MRAVLWKVDHPCFFDCFRSGYAGGDFRLGGGLFYLYRFVGTDFELYGDFFVSRLSGMNRCSTLVPWSKPGRYRRSTRTIGSEFGSTAEWACLRSCKQPEDAVERNCVGGAFGCSQQLFFKARRWLFGLFFSWALLDVEVFFNHPESNGCRARIKISLPAKSRN